MRLRLLCPLLALLCLLAGCTGPNAQGPERYSATYFTLFDTVTTITGYAGSEAEFDAQAQAVHDALLDYHRLYDIYHDYEGMANLKTVNDCAGAAPVEVDGRIIDLLLFAREMYDATGGRINTAAGSVLSLWHDAREAALDGGAAALPAQAALDEAAGHISFEDVVIDREASTVYLPDPAMRLDVGAIAKGYAAAQVCRTAPQGLLIDLGGNVCATGPRADGTPWLVGIQDPNGGENFLSVLDLSAGAVVTSGDYQRYFELDGVRYHHIIDLSTGQPARRWRSVTVVCADSGAADALSTALFTLPFEDGQALLEPFDAQAMWVAADGSRQYSAGFSSLVHS